MARVNYDSSVTESDETVVYPGIQQDVDGKLYLASDRNGEFVKVDAAHGKKYHAPSPYLPTLIVTCPDGTTYEAQG